MEEADEPKAEPPWWAMFFIPVFLSVLGGGVLNSGLRSQEQVTLLDALDADHVTVTAERLDLGGSSMYCVDRCASYSFVFEGLKRTCVTDNVRAASTVQLKVDPEDPSHCSSGERPILVVAWGLTLVGGALLLGALLSALGILIGRSRKGES